MAKPAVIIIDMLKDFFEVGHLADTRNELVQQINKLIKTARSNCVPIIWVRQEFEPDLSDAFLAQRKENIRMTIKGTQGVEILDELYRQPNDFEVVKKRYSAFYRTDLDEVLGKLRPSKLILAGVNTHACIRMAAIDAYQRDFEVEVVSDCVSSKDQEHHRMTLDYMDGHICKVVDLANLNLSSI